MPPTLSVSSAQLLTDLAAFMIFNQSKGTIQTAAGTLYCVGPNDVQTWKAIIQNDMMVVQASIIQGLF